ncbi:MAG TPA: septation regulator SpoVG [Firmicutes bacterium]|nr:septation regulator SpoVG [Bacillota bacterium]
MKIGDVRIREVRNTDGKLKAVASITIDDCFVVHDIKIFEREDGFAIAMPSRKTSDGKYKDIAHPLNTETRELLQDMILAEYRRILTEK